jgi:hypothetical protein
MERGEAIVEAMVQKLSQRVHERIMMQRTNSNHCLIEV